MSFQDPDIAMPSGADMAFALAAAPSASPRSQEDFSALARNAAARQTMLSRTSNRAEIFQAQGEAIRAASQATADQAKDAAREASERAAFTQFSSLAQLARSGLMERMGMGMGMPMEAPAPEPAPVHPSPPMANARAKTLDEILAEVLKAPPSMDELMGRLPGESDPFLSDPWLTSVPAGQKLRLKRVFKEKAIERDDVKAVLNLLRASKLVGSDGMPFESLSTISPQEAYRSFVDKVIRRPAPPARCFVELLAALGGDSDTRFMGDRYELTLREARPDAAALLDERLGLPPRPSRDASEPSNFQRKLDRFKQKTDLEPEPALVRKPKF